MNHTPASLSRRSLFRAIAIGAGAATIGTVAAPHASASPQVLATIVDYSAGVPSARAVKAAGHIGAIRYVSQRRPGANWMLGKPVTLKETQDFANHGLYTASVYQFGSGSTADWLQGAAGATTHAPQAISLHRAAGGPTGVPIYAAIDDNPTRAQYENQIRPYLQAFRSQLQAAGYSLGIYGNYSTLEWAIQDGIGEYFWQHNWGSQGKIHPRAHLHQVRIDKDSIEGVGVDINHVYKTNWGQWMPGVAPQPVPTPAAPPVEGAAGASSSNLPDVNINGVTITGQQIQQGVEAARHIAQLSS